MNLRGLDKMTEKDGLKGFKKLKVADFTLKKEYQRNIIEEIVEERIRKRRGEELYDEDDDGGLTVNRGRRKSVIEVDDSEE